MFSTDFSTSWKFSSWKKNQNFQWSIFEWVTQISHNLDAIWRNKVMVGRRLGNAISLLHIIPSGYEKAEYRDTFEWDDEYPNLYDRIFQTALDNKNFKKLFVLSKSWIYPHLLFLLERFWFYLLCLRLACCGLSGLRPNRRRSADWWRSDGCWRSCSDRRNARLNGWSDDGCNAGWCGRRRCCRSRSWQSELKKDVTSANLERNSFSFQTFFKKFEIKKC